MNRPSYFELIAVEYFEASLEPALSYALALGSRHSRWSAWGLSHSLELFYGVKTLLDLHHLRLYRGTWAENFYSLQRSAAEFSLKKALLWSALLPYLRAKLEVWYEPYRPRALVGGGEMETEARREVKTQWGKHLVIQLYPYVTSLYEGAHLLIQLRYLHSLAYPYFSPNLYFANQQMQRIDSATLTRHEQISEMMKFQIRRKFRYFRLLRWLSEGVLLALNAAEYLLPAIVFLFRFSEWWNSEENQALLGKRQLVPLIPPAPPEAPVPVIALPSDPRKFFFFSSCLLLSCVLVGTCPVCLQRRTNPAVGPSGYVCCYPCLFKAAEDEQQDPVTHRPLQVDQIKKIYL
jgi:hypothetical protein